MNDDHSQNSAISLLLVRTVVAMVMLITIALGAALALQMAYSPTTSPDPTLMTLLSGVVGVILGNYGAVFSFQFGSTPSSKAKDDTISTQAAALAGKPPTPDPDAPPLKVDLVGTPGNPPPEEKP